MALFPLQDDKEAAYSKIEPILDSSIGYSDDDPHYRHPSRRQQRHSWLQTLLYSGVLCICSLAAFFAGSYTARSIDSINADGEHSPVPKIPFESVTFQPDPKFSFSSSFSNSSSSSLSEAESDAAWTSLLPSGEGFIFVETPEHFGLPPGKTPNRDQKGRGSEGAFYDLSVFHQLHCLVKVREHVRLVEFAMSEMVRESSAGDGKLDISSLKRLLQPLKQERHMEHCFDYLRQGIMCAGDMSLEGVIVSEEENDGMLRRSGSRVVDGWGMKHQCKSWDAIMEYVRANEHV
ncbi:hypothetical protein CB0940_08584 [Cercospora beticola]|uniref:Oxidase ustYa n=1 Tax=Cercospora beticola TaxID=122368 RepID=A0A2G5HQQ1_CERBT|nr:hypothetical protein CB0940_08584 [Cercospora beticola]PIA94848.1 hypothetical protein CB0940_08584 [Cercospora beticola]WPB05161.1 hypothetical protein RHO25_009811 [Cercospora beticola]CAK1364947.1 unnamed protein product [Cercospora beticola]